MIGEFDIYEEPELRDDSTREELLDRIFELKEIDRETKQSAYAKRLQDAKVDSIEDKNAASFSIALSTIIFLGFFIMLYEPGEVLELGVGLFVTGCIHAACGYVFNRGRLQGLRGPSVMLATIPLTLESVIYHAPILAFIYAIQSVAR